MKRALRVVTVTLLAAGLSGTALPDRGEEALVGAIIPAEAGYQVPFPDGRLLRIKIGPESTGSSHLVMLVEDMPPGTVIPIHRHNRDEEILFVQRGVVTVTLGEREAAVEAGGAVYIPPGVWIGVKNTGHEPATVVALFAHPDMETCFRLLAKEESGAINAEERLEYNRACAWEVRQ